MKAPPPDWAKDKLTASFDEARLNQFATFHNKNIIVRRAIEVDECFLRVLVDLKDPVPLLPINFMFRAHSAFRAATATAFSGQSYETMVLCRVCLENGLYGQLIGSSFEKAEIWIKRNDSNEAKKKEKKIFSAANAIKNLREENPELGDICQKLYDDCIDFGAHPSVQGVIGNMKIEEGEGKKILNHMYLNGDGVQLDHSLKVLIEVGLCSLSIFEQMYINRFIETGTSTLIEKIKENY